MTSASGQSQRQLREDVTRFLISLIQAHQAQEKTSVLPDAHAVGDGSASDGAARSDGRSRSRSNGNSRSRSNSNRGGNTRSAGVASDSCSSNSSSNSGSSCSSCSSSSSSCSGSNGSSSSGSSSGSSSSSSCSSRDRGSRSGSESKSRSRSRSSSESRSRSRSSEGDSGNSDAGSESDSQSEDEAAEEHRDGGKRKRSPSSQVTSYCRNRRLRGLEFSPPIAEPPPPSRPGLSRDAKREVRDYLVGLDDESRIALLGDKHRCVRELNCSRTIAYKIWAHRDNDSWFLQGPGRPMKLSSDRLKKILVDTQDGFSSLSRDELRQKVVEACEEQAQETGSLEPTARSVDNYIAVLKAMGVKTVGKARAKDSCTAMSSFRNCMSVYAVAAATHDQVHPQLLMHLDPTTILFGPTADGVATAVVPEGHTTDVCRVGKKSTSLPHHLKLLAVANYNGAVGPLVYLYSVSDEELRKVNGQKAEGLQLPLKVPLYHAHPAGSLSPFEASVWFVEDIHDPRLVQDYLETAILPFMAQCKLKIAEYGESDSRAVLWLGPEVIPFVLSEPGIEWAIALNLDINIRPPEFSAVAQHWERSNKLKQPLRAQKYAKCWIPDRFRSTFEASIAGKLSLGTQKELLLQVLHQLNDILADASWFGDMRKGFEMLGPTPSLEEMMSTCQAYRGGSLRQRKEFKNMAQACIEEVLRNGGVSDTTFNELVAPPDALPGAFPIRALTLSNKGQLEIRNQRLVEGNNRAKEQGGEQQQEQEEEEEREERKS